MCIIVKIIFLCRKNATKISGEAKITNLKLIIEEKRMIQILLKKK